MYRKYQCFLHFYYFQLPKQTSQKHWYLHCVEKTKCKETRCLEAIFHIFSARAPQFKNQSFFAPFLPPFIRAQDCVKSQKNAKLHLNSTFCLSHSLQQSSRAKNWGRLSGPKNVVNCSFLGRTMHFTCKKGGPPS